jgi:hypothetical protein
VTCVLYFVNHLKQANTIIFQLKSQMVVFSITVLLIIAYNSGVFVPKVWAGVLDVTRLLLSVAFG